MKEELKQAWINVLGIKPNMTIRLNAQQTINIALEYERLLCLTFKTKEK